jgi:hypothetical protein
MPLDEPEHGRKATFMFAELEAELAELKEHPATPEPDAAPDALTNALPEAPEQEADAPLFTAPEQMTDAELLAALREHGARAKALQEPHDPHKVYADRHPHHLYQEALYLEGQRRMLLGRGFVLP